MKKMFLVRHAKSSWKYTELEDFERPLNKRGKRDAPFMGKLLYRKNIKPDVVVSSPASRAAATAKVICDSLEYPFEKIKFIPVLYGADEEEMLDVIHKLDDKYNSCLLFAHNPGLTEFANYLTEEDFDNIPTAGAVGISFNIDSWNQIEKRSGKTDFFEYPKKYFK